MERSTGKDKGAKADAEVINIVNLEKAWKYQRKLQHKPLWLVIDLTVPFNSPRNESLSLVMVVSDNLSIFSSNSCNYPRCPFPIYFIGNNKSQHWCHHVIHRHKVLHRLSVREILEVSGLFNEQWQNRQKKKRVTK